MASKVMDEAIDLAIEGHSPYPNRAVFIDADLPTTHSEIERAARKGAAAVVVSADGSTRIIWPKPS
ncbi:MAG: hypothetical protein ACTHN3_01870 [Solirubrobacterales bacterium]